MRRKLPVPSTIEINLTEEDISGALTGRKGLWFGHFTPEEVVADLHKYGILSHLEDRGYFDLRPELECEPFQGRMRITGLHKAAPDPQLLVEVKARRTTEKLLGKLCDEEYSSLVIDWVLFQDPCASFDEEHPRLPGQEHPGLHLLKLGNRLLLDQVKVLDVDLILTYPAHFHNAVFYSPHFRFLEPATEGHFLALKRCLVKEPGDLGRASQALENGEVLDSAGRKVFWSQKAQALPHRESIAEQLFGAQYEAAVVTASRQDFRYQEV